MPDIAAKILLVDDDARSLMAMETLVAGPGRIVIKADSGQEALRQVLRHEFAVILLDVRMPRVDGFETAELIRQREQSRYVPIIFLSAVDKLDDDVFRGLASGAVDYLFKPVVPEVLQSKVAVFVELYRMRERVKREAIRHGEARFRLLVNSIKDYSIILLSPDELESRRAIDRRVPGERNHRPAFFLFLHGRRHSARISGIGAPDCGLRGPA